MQNTRYLLSSIRVVRSQINLNFLLSNVIKFWFFFVASCYVHLMTSFTWGRGNPFYFYCFLAEIWSRKKLFNNFHKLHLSTNQHYTDFIYFFIFFFISIQFSMLLWQFGNRFVYGWKKRVPFLPFFFCFCMEKKI